MPSSINGKVISFSRMMEGIIEGIEAIVDDSIGTLIQVGFLELEESFGGGKATLVCRDLSH